MDTQRVEDLTISRRIIAMFYLMRKTQTNFCHFPSRKNYRTKVLSREAHYVSLSSYQLGRAARPGIAFDSRNLVITIVNEQNAVCLKRKQQTLADCTLGKK